MESSDIVFRYIQPSPPPVVKHVHFDEEPDTPGTEPSSSVATAGSPPIPLTPYPILSPSALSGTLKQTDEHKAATRRADMYDFDSLLDGLSPIVLRDVIRRLWASADVEGQGMIYAELSAARQNKVALKKLQELQLSTDETVQEETVETVMLDRCRRCGQKYRDGFGQDGSESFCAVHPGVLEDFLCLSPMLGATVAGPARMIRLWDCCEGEEGSRGCQVLRSHCSPSKSRKNSKT